jgi:hypothetical protein
VGQPGQESRCASKREGLVMSIKEEEELSLGIYKTVKRVFGTREPDAAPILNVTGSLSGTLIIEEHSIIVAMDAGASMRIVHNRDNNTYTFVMWSDKTSQRVSAPAR